MINSLTRILTRWLRHPEHGLNGVLGQIPRDPRDRMPSEVFVYDDVDSLEGADGSAPAHDGPVLLVMAWSPIGIELKRGRPAQDVAQTRFALLLMQRSDRVEDAAQGRRDTGVLVEALIESLGRLSQPSLSSPVGGPDLRREGAMQLLSVDRVEEHRTGDGIKQMKLTGGLLVTISAQRLPSTPTM